MQTVETLNEGLRRAFRLTIAASEISARVDAELKRVAPQVKMPGFRPGKVPANLVRKMHGPALMQDALNASVQQGVQSLMQEKALRPATQPQVELADGYEDGGDAELTVSLEVLPDVPAPAIDDLKLERLTVPVADAAVDEQLLKFASANKSWDDAGDKAAAQGDLVTMDFAGRTADDGVAFEGGTGTDMAVEIGSGRLIPGFEDQVVGATAGEERQIAVTFPADYPAKELAGRDATFDLTIKSVKTAGEPRVDEELAKNLGLESLDKLKELVRGRVEQELNGLTRTHMKRKLLDQLAAGHDFEVPPSMVEAEFGQIWQQLEHEATHEADPDKARAEMEAERDDYRRIAERRVRLGLLLSEIGQANGVEVSQAEMNRLIAQAAQQYGPEDRQRFVQYVQQEPMAAAQLRAPLYEDKVVDFLFTRAEVTDRESTREELEAAIESEDGFATGTHLHDHGDHDHAGHDHDHRDHADHEHGHGADNGAAEPAAVETPVKKPRPKKALATDEGEAAKSKKARGKPAAPDAVEEGASVQPEALSGKASPAETDGSAVEGATPAKKPRARKVKAADA